MSRALCQSIARSLVRDVLARGDLSSGRSLGRALVRHLPAALFGTPGHRWIWKAALALAKLRCRLWRFSEPRLQRAYCETWDLMGRLRRLEYVTRQPEPESALLRGYRAEVASLPPERVVGFHALEKYQRRSFRWTDAVFALELPLAAGDHEVRFDTHGLRQGEADLRVQGYFNGHRLPAAAIRYGDRDLVLRIALDQFSRKPLQRLIVTCNPLRPWEQGIPDQRELGLPVFAIDVVPLAIEQCRLASAA